MRQNQRHALNVIGGSAVGLLIVGAAPARGNLLGTPVTTISHYTGGESGEGLDLSGTYLQTVNIGKTTAGDVSVQGYNFAPLSQTQSPPGAAIAGTDFDYANFQNTNYTPPRPFDYGSNADDDALEAMMGKVEYGNVFSGGPYTRNLGIGFTTTPGTTYELKLLIPNVDNFELDFEAFLEGVSLGQFSTNNLDSSGNHDGTVLTTTFTMDDPSGSNLDINVFQLNTSQSLVTVGAATLKAVPEPATISLLGVAGLGLLRRRSRN